MRAKNTECAGAQVIEIVEAAENNLRIAQLLIPRHRLVALTGPSGAGKSSLLFNILAREAARRSQFAHDLFWTGAIAKPRVASVRGLSFPVTVRLRRSTARMTSLASFMHVYPALRLLFFALAERRCTNCGSTLNGADNQSIEQAIAERPAGATVSVVLRLSGISPEEFIGAAERFAALGYTKALINNRVFALDQLNLDQIEDAADPGLMVDRFRSGSSAPARLTQALRLAQQVGFGAASVVVEESGRTKEFSLTDEDICANCGISQRRIRPADFSYYLKGAGCAVCGGFGEIVPAASGDQLNGVLTSGFVEGCPACRGARVNPEVRALTLGGLNFEKLFSGSFEQAARWAAQLQLSSLVSPTALQLASAETFAAVLTDLTQRLEIVIQLGLDYLELFRTLHSISAGEFSRMQLARTLFRPVSGMLYLLDEPTAGLHSSEINSIIKLLGTLVDRGNSVILVEHRPEVMRAADYLIELGPVGGAGGGLVTAAGDLEALLSSQTLTGRYLKGERSDSAARKRRSGDGTLTVNNVCLHNLRKLTVALPLQAVTIIRGRSGAGKSTLLFSVIQPALERLIAANHRKDLRGAKQTDVQKYCNISGWEKISAVVDCTVLEWRRYRRSTVASASGALRALSRLFSLTRQARALGRGPRYFLFNCPEGACESCRGTGESAKSLFGERFACPACGGNRYRREIDAIRYRGLSIAEALALTVDEAVLRFKLIPKAAGPLTNLQRVGLGYLKLNQSSSSLSGGELQRLRLVSAIAHRSSRGVLYLFDEPSRGVHPAEVGFIGNLFDALVESGGTVIAIDNNEELQLLADQLIELGPGGGKNGGRLIYAGAPDERFVAD